ncbi:MAG: sugar ABC transporter permease [Clostridia bacterium]|nr:sugar ABC transporter permease [Clostridia bacterium]
MKIAKKHTPFILTIPSLTIVLMVVVFPIAYCVYISFTNMNMYHWNKFNVIGIDNYIRTLKGIDVEFYRVLLRTIIWTVSNLALTVAIGLSLALLLNMKEIKYKGIIRTILILPWAVPSYITSLMWKGMFNHDFGIINAALEGIGIGRIEWLTSPTNAMIACIIVNIWLSFPFMMVVCLGALQSIDPTYYEAAEMDGASGIQKFTTITLRLIQPALIPAIILTTFVTFKQFDIIYLMTRGLAGKLDVVMTYGYNIAFDSKNYSLSSAFSVIVFFLLLGLTIVNMKVTKADRGMN